MVKLIETFKTKC